MKIRPFIVALLASGAVAAAVTLPTPIAAEVYVKDGAKATVLRGKLTGYDEQQFTLHIGQDENKTLNWADITPASAYALRMKTVDRQKAGGWMDLGRFAWSLSLKDQAKAAFRSAVRLDASNQSQVDAVLASPAGTLAAAPKSDDLIKTGSAPAAKTAADPTDPKSTNEKVVPFLPATPQESQNALAFYHQQAEKVQQKLGLKFQSFETDHFLVFTNWDERETDFMRTNLEMAYRVVARQFDMSPKDNVFVGKLPVYMFDKFDQFADFAEKIDKWPTRKTMMGYFGSTNGIGHMAMWKPDKSVTGSNNIEDAKRLWAYVLVHEFTHAFLSRYRSNVFVPRWLNEGIAEVIATGEFPNRDTVRVAHLMAVENKDLTFLFDSQNVPTGEYYPVMQTMTQLLINENRQNFLKLINAVKDGEDCEDALKRLYNTDFENFARVWREWALRQRG